MSKVWQPNKKASERSRTGLHRCAAHREAKEPAAEVRRFDAVPQLICVCWVNGLSSTPAPPHIDDVSPVAEEKRW